MSLWESWELFFLAEDFVVKSNRASANCERPISSWPFVTIYLWNWSTFMIIEVQTRLLSSILF